MAEDKEIVYSNRVLQGNWYESRAIEEYRESSRKEQLLSKFRRMSSNLNRPIELSPTTGTVSFGYKVAIVAPHVPASDPPEANKQGLILGGRITANQIYEIQELMDGCQMVGLVKVQPAARSTFIITSADYCDRTDDTLNYNDEFLLKLACTSDTKPLYIRYDMDPFPGLTMSHPIYLSANPVSNTRWRVLPVRRPDVTRFELEGTPVPANSDIILNHCATNLNLAVNIGDWSRGFHGKVCGLALKTCLDIYGKEEFNNIWHIHVSVSDK